MPKTKSIESAFYDSEVKNYNKQFDDDDDDLGPSESVEYWKYFAKAKQLFGRIPGYELEISSSLPDGFRWLKVLKEPENGLESLSPTTRYLSSKLLAADYEVLQDFCLDNCNDDMKFLSYLLPIVALGEGDARSKIRRGIAQELSLRQNAEVAVNILHSTRLSETKPEKVVSFIPELEQFPASLRNSGLKIDDFLVWLYGPAERSALALHIGRACVGPQKATLAGELDEVTHSYRTAIIIQSEPFLGKTWFNEFLVEGFKFCNLKTAPIQDLGTRFGHGEWLTSNWAYADDTTKSMIREFYSSSMLKTVCTNGLVKSEQKGVDSFSVKAVCAPILLANDLDCRDIAKADSGNADRIQVLATKSLSTLKAWRFETKVLEDCGSALPAEICEYLTIKLKITKEVLAAYLLRLCCDYFEGFDLESMTAQINTNKEMLYHRNNASTLGDLAKACVFSMIISERSVKSTANWRDENFAAVNSSKFILDSLVQFGFFKSSDIETVWYPVKVALFLDYVAEGKPASHPWRGFSAYGSASVARVVNQVGVYYPNIHAQGLDMTTTPELFSKVFTNLIDVAGVSASYNLQAVQSKWRHALDIDYSYLLDCAQRVREYLRFKDRGDVVRAILKRPRASHLEAATIKIERQFAESDTFEALTYYIEQDVTD